MKAVLLLSMAAVVLAAGSDDDDSSAVAAGSDSSDSKVSCPPSPPSMREGVVCGKEDSTDYFAKSGEESLADTVVNIDCVSWCQSKATELNKQLFAAETYMYYRAYGEGSCPANEGGNCGDICYCYEESACPFVCDVQEIRGGDAYANVYFYSGTTFLAAQPIRGNSKCS